MVRGEFRKGGDVRALRKFTGLSQIRFADCVGISAHTSRNWEQDRRTSKGPALALLRVVASHPRVVHENLAPSP